MSGYNQLYNELCQHLAGEPCGHIGGVDEVPTVGKIMAIPTATVQPSIDQMGTAEPTAVVISKNEETGGVNIVTSDIQVSLPKVVADGLKIYFEGEE